MAYNKDYTDEEIRELKKQIKNCDMSAPYIFVSYSSRDSGIVYKDVIELQKRGVNVWIDKELEMRSGIDWQKEALESIEDYHCRMILFYTSEYSMTSPQVAIELLHSKTEGARSQHNEENIHIIPVDLDKIKNNDIVNWVNKYIVSRQEYREKKEIEIGEHKADSRHGVAKIILKEIFGESNNITRTYGSGEHNADYYDTLIKNFNTRQKEDNDKGRYYEAYTVINQSNNYTNIEEVDKTIEVENKGKPQDTTVSLEKNYADSVEAAADTENKFKAWLKNEEVSESAIKAYIPQLRGSLIKKLQLEDIFSTNLFEYTNIENFEKLYTSVSSLESFIWHNSSMKNRPSAALKAYLDYLKSLESISSTSTLVSVTDSNAVAATCIHEVTKTDVNYGLIRFKKSTGFPNLFMPEDPITLIYKDIVHDTKIHKIETGRISSVPFMRNIPIGTKLKVVYDGVRTITITEEPDQEELDQEDYPLLYLTSRGSDATGRETKDGFVVYKGSLLSSEPTNVCPNAVKKKREQYQNQIKNGRLTEDIEFNSPSGASDFVIYSNTNGNVEWKDANGRKLGEIKKDKENSKSIDASKKSIEDNDSEEKIGVYVRKVMRQLSDEQYNFPQEDIKLMVTYEWSKKVLNLGYPLLKEILPNKPMSEQKSINGHNRYWAEEFQFNGKNYLVTSEWYKHHRPPFNNWLKNLGRK